MLPLTIQQKLVRVFSSAAVCGLSFTFILGEAIDHKAKDISLWAIDAALIPVHYQPAQPINASLQGIAISELKEKWVAANSANISLPQEMLAAIPPAVIPMEEPAPLKMKVTKVVTETLPTAEVEKVLLSIHDATSQLNTIIGEEKEGQVLVDGPVVIKSLSESKETGRKPSEIVSLDTWSIRGKITSAKKEAGHFEVGLFSKIDQDGVPVGFPLVQQILPAGIMDFELNIPHKIEKGFLYGVHVATKSGKRTWIAPPVNPRLKQDRQFAELVYQQQEDTISSTASASEKQAPTFSIRGSVSTFLFSKGAAIPQGDVVVKVRGRKESVRTEKNGDFLLELPILGGTVYLEFLKAGYHPLLVPIATDGGPSTIKVELVSRDAVDQIARNLGLRQLSSKSVFLGKITNPDGTPLIGASFQFSLKADGPFYFGENGVPSAQLKATTADGRFLFLNVEPGTGFVESSAGGEAIAPFLFSSVEGGEAVIKNLVPVSGNLKGRIFNPVGSKNMTHVARARLRIEGTADWSTTDSYGAFYLGPLRWMRGERISIEFSAEKYQNHRYTLVPDKKVSAINLFAFPASYIDMLTKSMDLDLDPYTGVVIGKVSGKSVRIDALADHSVVNGSEDFYFDAQGKLRGSHAMTDPTYGTYMIFNVPKGRILLHGNDSNGVLRYSDSVVTSPTAISVIMD